MKISYRAGETKETALATAETIHGTYTFTISSRIGREQAHDLVCNLIRKEQATKKAQSKGLKK